MYSQDDMARISFCDVLCLRQIDPYGKILYPLRKSKS